MRVRCFSSTRESGTARCGGRELSLRAERVVIRKREWAKGFSIRARLLVSVLGPRRLLPFLTGTLSLYVKRVLRISCCLVAWMKRPHEVDGEPAAAVDSSLAVSSFEDGTGPISLHGHCITHSANPFKICSSIVACTFSSNSTVSKPASLWNSQNVDLDSLLECFRRLEEFTLGTTSAP